MTVSGSDGSRIEVSASTNGTAATTPANASGSRFTAAPTSRPPALPPSATIRSLEDQPLLARCRAQATKSVKVFILLSILPSSYQCRPISPPPRMWAIAKPTPRSSSESREIVK